MELSIDSKPLPPPISVLCIIETLGRGGGAEQLVASLAVPLRARGVVLEFVDLFSWPDDLGVELQRQGFVVHRLELRNRWNLLQGFQRLKAIVGKRKPMIVWGHLYFGNLYASLLGLCLSDLTSVITLHSTGPAQMSPRTLKGRLSSALEQWLNRCAEFKVAVSSAVRDAYHSSRGWNDVQVIYNGIDIDAIPTYLSPADRAAMRQQFNLASNEFVITVPARFVPEKGHSVLIDAVSLLAREQALYPRFLLIGEFTPLVKTLRTQCKRKNILEDQIIFLPPVPQQELFRILGCSNCIVLPSVQEAFGMAAVEAMATESPLILSRVGGMAELDPLDECVTYVPPGDARALADAIASMIREYSSQSLKRLSGRQIAVERFSLDRCASAWRSLFFDISTNSERIES